MTDQIGKVERTASGIEFVRPLDNASAKHVPNKVDRWRAENPNHVHRQEVKTTGGAWVQFWGFRVYYGPCADCGGLVTTRRKVAHKRSGIVNTGRWPKYCRECNRKRAHNHDAGAAVRMATMRKRRRENPEQPRRGVDPAALTQANNHGGLSRTIVRTPQPLVCRRCLQPTGIVAMRERATRG